MLLKLRQAFFLFGITLLLLIIFLPGYTKLQELRDKNSSFNSKIKRLKVENTLLEQQLKNTEEDPLYQEKIAREKMGVVRKGEVPVKVVPEEQR